MTCPRRQLQIREFVEDQSSVSIFVMKVAILLILYFLIVLAAVVLPPLFCGAILRLAFRSWRPALVALPAAILVLIVADVFSINPIFHTLLELHDEMLSRVENDSASTLPITAAVLIGGFIGAIAIPFHFAFAGVKAVDRFRRRRGPHQDSSATPGSAPSTPPLAPQG